jgi:hypothetical protein
MSGFAKRQCRNSVMPAAGFASVPDVPAFESKVGPSYLAERLLPPSEEFRRKHSPVS